MRRSFIAPKEANMSSTVSTEFYPTIRDVFTSFQEGVKSASCRHTLRLITLCVQHRPRPQVLVLASVELNATARQCFTDARITAPSYTWSHVLSGKFVDESALPPYSGVTAVPSLFPVQARGWG